MTRHPAIAIGWLTAVPGFAILAALAIVATPLFGLLGCRTAGILSIACGSDLVFAMMEPLWIVVLVAASFPPVSGPAVLYSLGFAVWRAIVRWRARRAGP